MGLGDFLGKMAGEAVKKVQYESERYQRMVKLYEGYSDDKLIREWKNVKSTTDYTKAKVVSDILKKRGYGN